jgi:predicted Holliday junction resolvase-like endonuclease
MISTIAIVILLIYALYTHFFSAKPDQAQQMAELMRQIPQPGTTIPMSHFREVVDKKEAEINSLIHKLEQTSANFEKLKGEQQSKAVRLGQISEQVLPFHAEFPYDYKKLKPLFQPVDYIYFGDESIVFIEMKMGTSQLSENQRNIRRLISEGKVRFEEHRIDEQGYKFK